MLLLDVLVDHLFLDLLLLGHDFFLRLLEDLAVASHEVFAERENAREAEVHSLDHVGHLDILSSLFGHLLYVVSRGGVVRDVDESGEAVEAVPNGNVQRLSEDAVLLIDIGDHLGVAA